MDLVLWFCVKKFRISSQAWGLLTIFYSQIKSVLPTMNCGVKPSKHFIIYGDFLRKRNSLTKVRQQSIKNRVSLWSEKDRWNIEDLSRNLDFLNRSEALVISQFYLNSIPCFGSEHNELHYNAKLPSDSKNYQSLLNNTPLKARLKPWATAMTSSCATSEASPTAEA